MEESYDIQLTLSGVKSDEFQPIKALLESHPYWMSEQRMNHSGDELFVSYEGSQRELDELREFFPKQLAEILGRKVQINLQTRLVQRSEFKSEDLEMDAGEREYRVRLIHNVAVARIVRASCKSDAIKKAQAGEGQVVHEYTQPPRSHIIEEHEEIDHINWHR